MGLQQLMKLLETPNDQVFDRSVTQKKTSHEVSHAMLNKKNLMRILPEQDKFCFSISEIKLQASLHDG